MLVITLGDPFSVNCEVLSPSLDALQKASFPTVLVGSRHHFDEQLKLLGVDLANVATVTRWDDVALHGLSFLDTNHSNIQAPSDQLTAEERGELSTNALYKLRSINPACRPLAVITCPIDKHACTSAGFDFPGQTEFFESIWNSEAVMLLAGPRLRVALVTNHVALSEVASLVSEEKIIRKLKLLSETLSDLLQIDQPTIGVCGLNPHAGDHGLFGNEEGTCIVNAVNAFNTSTTAGTAIGPLPADTAFYHAFQGRYDAVLAMYHDQGLGPLKLAHFHSAVNISGGLQHLRVSPDHGPARDLYMKQKASPESFMNAVKVATRYLTIKANTLQ